MAQAWYLSRRSLHCPLAPIRRRSTTAGFSEVSDFTRDEVVFVAALRVW